MSSILAPRQQWRKLLWIWAITDAGADDFPNMLWVACRSYAALLLHVLSTSKPVGTEFAEESKLVGKVDCAMTSASVMQLITGCLGWGWSYGSTPA